MKSTTSEQQVNKRISKLEMKKMSKEVEMKADGRSIIFYSFEKTVNSVRVPESASAGVDSENAGDIGLEREKSVPAKTHGDN